MSRWHITPTAIAAKLTFKADIIIIVIVIIVSIAFHVYSQAYNNYYTANNYR
jgi:hypothetical protein